MIQPQAITLNNREDFILLLEKLKDDNGKIYLANDALVVARDGETYFKEDVCEISTPPFDKLYPNLPLIGAIQDKFLCGTIISGIPSITEEIELLFRCPISYEVTMLPVITPEGVNFDFQSIMISLLTGDKNPVSRRVLKKEDLIFNRLFAKLIFLYVQSDKKIEESFLKRMEDLQEECLKSQEPEARLELVIRGERIKAIKERVIKLSADSKLYSSLCWVCCLSTVVSSAFLRMEPTEYIAIAAGLEAFSMLAFFSGLPALKSNRRVVEIDGLLCFCFFSLVATFGVKKITRNVENDLNLAQREQVTMERELEQVMAKNEKLIKTKEINQQALQKIRAFYSHNGGGSVF